MKRYISIILVLLIFSNLHSQDQNISIRQLPIIDQLPSNSVLQILQDKEGYMWFGTQDGLCRYDGYRLKIFRSNLNDTVLLTNNKITALAEDFNENIWIGTDQGLNILNKNNYSINPHPDSTLLDKSIFTLLHASDSTVWVGYNGGIRRYNTDFSLVEEYSSNTIFKNIPPTNTNYLFEDSYQNVWILLWREGLYKFKKENNEIIKYPRIGNNDNPFKIFQDDHNNYWIGTWDEGLFKFNPNSVSKDTYKQISSSDGKNYRGDDRFYCFTQDSNSQYIWAMSLSGMSTYYYNSEGDIIPVNTKKLFRNTNNIFSQILKEKSGSLWLGAFSEGIFKIDFNKPSIENFPINVLKNKTDIAPSFTSLCQDKECNIWLNQNRVGLFIYNPSDNTINFYDEINELKDRPELSEITYINYISGLDEIWISNKLNSKILKIKSDNSVIKYIHESDLGKIDNHVKDIRIIFEDDHSNVWIGTKNALYVKPFSSEKIILVEGNIGMISSITQDQNRIIWIGTEDKGLYKLPIPNEYTADQINALTLTQIKHQLLGNKIQSISADQSGILWIGTKDGNLLSFNASSNTIKDITIQCGLNGESILDIISDKYNNLWITTYKKIIEFNPQSKAYYSYTKEDGMQINSHLVRSFYKPKDSKYIYIGGNRGYSRFTPSEHLLLPPKKTEVKITDIKIQNHSIYESGKDDQYNKLSKELILYPSDNNIDIYFSSLNYDNPNKIRYAYKLEGIDDNWVYTKENRVFATYNQLPKGNYKFLVKSTDIHNLWGNYISELTIIKKPTIYETNLAFFIYILLFVLALYILIAIIIGRIQLLNKIKMSEFEKNKTEELTQTKLKYFTNISHDLLTPLTIISCLIDDIEITSPKSSRQLRLMRSNVVRLKRLLQQILDFRRIENGKMKLNISNADITAFINNICYNHFIPILTKKNINFTINSNPKDILAYFDADKIDKILFNLLSNAYKYTPEGGTITISLSSQKINQHTFLTIKISDTGVGIASNDLENIFSRFYNNKTLKGNDTHGIGLSLCRDLVELHHGTISVESELHKGSTFIIKMPIDKESYRINEINSDLQIGISEDINPLKDQEDIEIEKNTINNLSFNTHLLLVDDNMDLLQLMNQRLSRTHHVITAKNGREALQVIKSNNIDIIISDVMMPELDGLELCATLKSNIETSHISIILLTAKNSTIDRIECYNAGADAYISKPFEMKLLLARINNFIVKKQTKQSDFKSSFSIDISTLENHSIDDQFLKQAVNIIEKNLSKSSFDVNQFAAELNLSKSSLYRKMKALTGLAPIEFIRNIKLKHASIMLANSTVTIAEVAYSVGFSDPKYFSSCFKAEFNINPSEYQRKYIRNP